MTRRLLLPFLLLVLAACGSAQVAPEDRPRGRSDRLTYEEIQATRLATMWDVIQRLQPTWLNPQQERGIPAPVGIFLDGTRVGTGEYLRQIPASLVREARFLNNREISAELSRTQQAGIGSAIMLSTRAR